MSTTPSEPPIVQPYDGDKRYVPFYLTMLILSSIGTAINLVSSLVSIPAVLERYSMTPLYTYAAITTIVLTLGAVVALVLLWLKRPFGIWLKLSAYGLGIVTTGVMALTIEPVIQASIPQIIDRTPSISANTASSIMHISTYAGLGLSAAANVVFGILWYFAWKRQSQADDLTK